MKKICKRALALLLCVMVGCALLACEGSPAEAIAAAELKLAAVKSMHYETKMEMSMTAAGQKVDTITDMRADMTTDPLAMQMSMNMDMGVLGSIPLEMYIMSDGETLRTYTGISLEGMPTQWEMAEIEMKDIAQYDAKSSMSLYLDSATSFAEVGEEEINGEKATRYDGVITGENIERVLDAAGMNDQLASLGLGDDALPAVTGGLGDIPVCVWVSKASGLPVRYEMDMTAVMQGLTAQLLDAMEGGAAAGISYDRMYLSMTLSQFDEIAPITLPADAVK